MEMRKIAALLWLLCGPVPLLAELLPLHSNSVSASSASAISNPKGQEAFFSVLWPSDAVVYAAMLTGDGVA